MQRLEIKLASGEVLTARATGEDELAVIHSRLESTRFVRVGEDTIVRSDEVRWIRLRGDDDEPGLFDAVRSRIGGSMSTTYDPDQQTTQRQRAGGGPGPGFADQWVGYGRRPWAETKPFFLTSEFLTLVAGVIGILVAAAMTDEFDATRAWLYVTVLGAAYMVARGLAKAGTRDPNPREWGGDQWGR